MKLPNGSTHGAITYHRTDSVDLAPEFVESVLGWLQSTHPKLVPTKVTTHKDKAGSQGAHEAIRPVDVANTPERMKGYLSEKQLKIYTLIWQRAVASQCAPAQFQKSRVVIQSGTTFWEARGSILTSCSKPLAVMFYRNKPKGVAKDHYLKCVEGCADVVLFWNNAASQWKPKGEKKGNTTWKAYRVYLSGLRQTTGGVQLLEGGAVKEDAALLRCHYSPET